MIPFRNNRLRYAIALAGAGAIALAHGSALALTPAPVKVGEMDFIPTLMIKLGYDDNIEQAPSRDAESSFTTRIEPTLRLRAQERNNRYELSYRGAYELFETNQQDDRFNHYLLASSALTFSARSLLRLSAGFDYIQDVQNLTNRRFDEDGNKYQILRFGGLYSYGAESARAQVDLGADYERKRYENNRTSGSQTRAQEYDSPKVHGTLYYRVAPKTRALVGIRYADFDYDWSGSDLNSYNLTYFGGLTWLATGKTTGTVKVGYEDKHFDDRKDTSTTWWDALVTWRPVSHARIALATSSYIDEGSSTEDAVETRRYRLGWDHAWLDRLSSNVFVSREDKQYEGGTYGELNREDTLDTLGLGVTYKMRRWLDLGAEVQLKSNDSNLDDASYDRNTYFITANFSL
ncbi:outer membrane beta-barrel protein [Thiohalocapsa marina]|uniref:Outer membrane beta-barrel protein n=1 Tax=Thiohalocapsa marina TaxID=424902 RepID=A0A5M8FAJ7_9GAMM|nr:outer membrane beta-barrel protein [Thiohalocapsa marina]KAA6181853.1 outer membrane beta-barrel protein [Thiohalocapsa marina]